MVGPRFTNYTTTDGLGSNGVNGVFAVGSTVYAATSGGLSISTDGGATFTNRTTTEGLGSNSRERGVRCRVDGVRRHQWRVEHLDEWWDQFHQPHHRRRSRQQLRAGCSPFLVPADDDRKQASADPRSAVNLWRVLILGFGLKRSEQHGGQSGSS